MKKYLRLLLCVLLLVFGINEYLEARFGGGGAFGAISGYLKKVNTDILPSADNTYDLGSASRSFKDVHVDGSIIGGAYSPTDNITLADTKYLQLGSSKVRLASDAANFGDEGLVFTGSTDIDRTFNVTSGFLLYANTGLTGAGNFEPSWEFGSDGSVKLDNTSQGSAADRKFTVTMTSGMAVPTAPFVVGAATAPTGTDYYVQENTADTIPTVEIEQLGAGDVGTQYSIVGDAYAHGVDNTDDSYKISYASTAGTAVLGTNDRFIISPAGNIQIPNSLEIDADLNHDGSNVGFFATAPAAQAGTTDDIKDALTTYGLLQGTSATDLDLDGGTLTGTVIGPEATIDSKALAGLMDSFNGKFIEQFDAPVTSNGTTITLSLEKDGGGDLTMVFSDGSTTFDATPAQTISLTAGTDTVPQKNHIYILRTTKALTNNTSTFPLDTAELIRIAEVVVQSAATVQTKGPLAVRFWNDKSMDAPGQGHFSHAWARQRRQHAEYKEGSGIAVTVTITTNGGAADNVDVAATAGRVYQFHEQIANAFDTSTGTEVLVINDNTTPYDRTTDLNTALTDSTGASMADSYFTVVLLASISSADEQDNCFLNLPSGSYDNQDDAIDDVKGYNNYTLPADFKGYTYLIRAITLRHQSAASGTWTSIQEIDLLGKVPNNIAGGGVKAIVTKFTDSTFEIRDDGDPTKVVAFQASGITTATTRTITVPDQNVDLTPSTGTFEAADAGLLSIAGLTTAADRMIYTTASDTYAVATLTAAGLAILDDADASAQRTTLGVVIGTDVLAYDAGLSNLAGIAMIADQFYYTSADNTHVAASVTSFARSILDDANEAAFKATVNLEIGTDVLAYDAGLSNLAGIAMIADQFYYTSADNTHVAASVTSFARSILDDANEAAFKATVNLEIGTDVLAEQAIGIADNNLLEVDHISPADNDYAKFTANGLEGRSFAEVLADLNAQAGAAFDWNSQNLTNVGTIASDAITVDTNAANTVAIATYENTAGDFQVFRTDATPESAVTGSIGDLAIDGADGILYLKRTGSATNTGWQAVGGLPTFKSYTFVARDAALGENFQAGFYSYSAADSNLNQGSLTVTHGGANHPYAAHAFIVSGGNGTTDGSDLVLTVSGTSIADDGTRTGADSEVIEATAATSALDTYFETTKKWIGQITYTLSSTAGTTFNYDFNYGFCKYDDFGNRNFTITDFESTGLANANDGGFEIELLHHTSSGWTYAATGFVAGNTAVISMNTIHSTEQDIDNGEHFSFKRTGLTTAVSGTASEGVIVRVTTGANNSVSYMDTHIGVVLR